MYHIFWRLRRIPIGAQSNNNDICCRSRRACAFIWFIFSFLLSVSTRKKCQAINYTPPPPLRRSFSPLSLLCVCVCSPCVYCCSNGRSWEERSPPWWCHRPLYLESSAVGRVSAMGEREMLLPSFSSTQQQPTHTHAQLGASKCFRLHQDYGWWDGWTDGRELERRKE